MQDFINALTSERKHAALPEEFDYFGKLIGSWRINYLERDSCRAIKGEWHFSRVLEGMAVQDVIILPDYEYGTSLRIFNPATHAWDVAYGYTGKIIRLEARKQGEMIVLTYTEDENRKWVFVEIGEDKFHWQNVTVKENGEWRVNAEIYAER
ncbi:hypothetical protein [Allofournierella sp.]|uniref:hypothetical protein n=1 Tax=Allofournierella sp. TaxID=1940256 RepID=UPI003AB66AB4